MKQNNFDDKINLGKQFGLFSGLLLLFSASISLVFISEKIRRFLQRLKAGLLLPMKRKPY